MGVKRKLFVNDKEYILIYGEKSDKKLSEFVVVDEENHYLIRLFNNPNTGVYRTVLIATDVYLEWDENVESYTCVKLKRTS